MTKDNKIKSRICDNLVGAQALEASLLCTLTRADVIGPGIIDLNFKVKVEGPDSAGIVDALAKYVSQSIDFNGKACLEHDTCEHCQKFIKDVLHFSVAFGGSCEGNCPDCVPVRRSLRKRTKKTFTEDHVYEDKELDKVSNLGGQSRNKSVKKSKSACDDASSTSHTKHEVVGDVSRSDDIVSQAKSNTKVIAKDLACEICKDTFNNEAVFVDHLLKHSDLKLLKCAVCKGSFSSKYVLKKHLMRHVPEENRPYMCEICKKGFTEAFYYREHMKNHYQVKPYKCSQCSKRYSSGTALRRHAQEHVLGKGKGKDKRSKPSRKPIADDDAVDGKDGGANVLVDELEDEEQDLKGDTWENIGSNTELSDSCESDSGTKKTESFGTCDNVQMPKCDVVIQSKQALINIVTTPKSSKNVIFKCKLCSKDFLTESCLKEHQSIHSSDRPFPCNVCGKSFFNRQVMERHASKHIPPENWEHKCGVCDKKFSHISYLHDHKWIHADEKPYKCDQCDKCYVSSQSLRKHAISHKTGSHKCNVCHRRFPTAHRLAEHTYSHTGILPFSCHICQKRFKLHQAFTKHGQVHMTVRPLSCGDCKKTFYTQGDLDIHVRIHSGYRPFQCDVCGKTYTRKGILQNHALTHSEDYYVLKPCSVCGKQLRGDKALHQHLQTHQAEKKFVCEQCGKRFPSAKLLWSHKQTHKGHKPHACKHCGKMFRSRMHCMTHMKTHTGENLVQCPLCKDWFTDIKYLEKVHPRFCKGKQVFCSVCGRGLRHNQALQSHIGLHTGARPHGCDTCGRAFTKERFLQEHIKRHLEIKSHICRVCGKGFNTPSDLKKHENRHSSNRQMKSLLSDSVKPAQVQQISALETSATNAVSDVLSGGNILTISGPDTIIEEVHNPSDVGHISEEHVVLATIDINQIGSGHSSQYVTHPEYGVVQQTSVIQYHDSMQPVLQRQELQQQQQQQQLPQHEYMLAPDHQQYHLQG